MSAAGLSRTLLAAALLLFSTGCASTASSASESKGSPPPGQTQSTATYEENEIVAEVADFFGITAEAASQVVAKVFQENGRPTGYIRGEEVAGALGVGLRYGHGDLRLATGETRKVFWQGPSIGFDTGANASKVFTLIYGMHTADDIYQRYPGVSGSAYLVAGMGVNYQRRDDITLAPIRAGVGFRLGVNVGYLAYTRERHLLPF